MRHEAKGRGETVLEEMIQGEMTNTSLCLVISTGSYKDSIITSIVL